MDTSMVWQTLHAINCQEHTEKKGKFTYLGWTWAWAMVKQHYPEAVYTVEPENVMQDGTVEVNTTVTIGDITLPMWLAVTDFNNVSIKEPDSSAVANSRMRCLTKNLAMFGLGHYLYAGESMPQAPSATKDQFKQLTALVAEKNSMGVRVFSDAVGPEIMTQLFNMSESGRKTAFKEEVRDAYRHSNELAKALAEGLVNTSQSEDVEGFAEVVDEINDDEWLYVVKQLSETDLYTVRSFQSQHDLKGVPNGL